LGPAGRCGGRVRWQHADLPRDAGARQDRAHRARRGLVCDPRCAATPHRARPVQGFATADVRVVITVRDLARQIPATWQETLKNRSETPYAEYLATLFETWPSARRGSGGFWAAQDVEALVRRWSAGVGVERVTVVTVP